MVAFQSALVRLDALTGETWTATVERRDLVRRGYSSVLWSLRADVREWLHRAILRAGYPASALMEALLIGTREEVPADLYDGFKKPAASISWPSPACTSGFSMRSCSRSLVFCADAPRSS